MNAPELKPCPFCGGEAEWKLGGPGCAFLTCKSCPAETGDGSVPRIRDAWNRRADLPPTDAEVMNHPKVKALVSLLQETAEELDDYSPLTGKSIETAASKRIRAAIAAIGPGRNEE